jgi:hypothetical protein
MKNTSKHDVTYTQLEERIGLESQEKNKRPEALTLTGLCITLHETGYVVSPHLLYITETWAASH